MRNSGLFVGSRCSFRQNRAVGWEGWILWPELGGSDSQGGAICNVGVLFIEDSDFIGNKARGQDGAIGLSLIGQQVGDGGTGSRGGSGYGGVIFNAGVATLVNSTLVSNTCTGGEGGRGGSAAFYFTHGNYYYLGNGAHGGNGGSGLGSGVYSVGSAANLTNCTVALNTASAGFGGSGRLGTYSGSVGTNGSATGGIHASIISSLVNTLLVTNAPGNGSGNLTALGHNVSSDSSCNFTNTGSLNNADALLGPLANNGDPTLTMALLPGSPAIDAGDNASAPPTDQRGLPRPLGRAADIGAYEYAAQLQIERVAQNGWSLLLRDGVPGQTCRLLVSSTLSNWQSLVTNQIATDGTTCFQQELDPSQSRRF